ncbi:MAG: phosphate acyltransferase PlsX [Lentisphaerae bacterium]|nr:phosphate acyltransferase PlsX [Lentisphaerota bacterium]
MRIAVDAMGGDHAPREIILGAVQAAREIPAVSKVYLVGEKASIERELASCGGSDKLEVLHASESIEMAESPAQAVRKKKDSSIGRAVDLVKAGEADAVVSAGNTGAAVVAATLKLRTLEGVERPAIAAVIPTPSRPLVLVDAGATIDCSADLLAQFGCMGSVYSRMILGQENPVVGLLSIGGEAAKGNEITKEAFRILEDSPLNFRGNVEGHDLFKGETDVVVCDGFVGNIVLKTVESTALAIGYWMKREFKANAVRLLGAIFLQKALKSMRKRMDPEMYGGAPLLGVQGVCIITHGASSSRGVFHSMRVASESVDHHLNQAIMDEVVRMGNGA